jgi:NADPH-dependent 7-cyano-7-deazaguanine reductase QueF-like protein
MIAKTINYPMENEDFLNVISKSFNTFLNVGTSRSTAKLKDLHGAIAKDLADKLGNEYKVSSQGYGDDKEAKIEGRYIDKMVDITISKDNKPVAGIAVKFVMQNYKQNSNNYFENMLGETANIRCSNVPYFQVFIVFDKLPYYDNSGVLKHWELFNANNSHKYIILSNDDTKISLHTPDKTLLYVVHLPDNESLLGKKKSEYMDYYKTSDTKITLSSNDLGKHGNSLIVNDWTTFRDKVYHAIMAI